MPISDNTEKKTIEFLLNILVYTKSNVFLSVFFCSFPCSSKSKRYKNKESSKGIYLTCSLNSNSAVKQLQEVEKKAGRAQ